MKTQITIPVITLIVGGIAGAYIYNRAYQHDTTPVDGQLKLEEILSIKELHLVRHNYNDIFFIHRKNDPKKPVRVMVTVPVTVTAYINLKEIEIVKVNDTVKAVILPKAKLNDPAFEIDKSKCAVRDDTTSMQEKIFIRKSHSI